MTEDKRFSKESLLYVFGEVLSKSLAFLLLPIYASYLSVDDFAVLSIVSVFWPLIVVIIGQGFSSYIMRGYYEYPNKKQFFGTILLLSMVIGLLLASLIHLIGPWLVDQIFKEITYKPYLQYGVFFAVFRLYFTHVISYFRAKRAAKTSVILSFLLFFINLVAVVFAIFFIKADLKGILDAQVFAFLLVTIIFTIVISSEISLKINFSYIVPGILFVLPLIPHAVSSWLSIHVSRVFIERCLSLTELSIYTVASQLALILSVINNGLNQAWIPFVYANYDKEDFSTLFNTNARKIILLVLLVGMTVILFSKEILILMGKSEYMVAINILPILILSFLFQIFYFLNVAILVYHKKTKLLPIISITSGIVTIFLNILLIPIIGIYGAALCVVISFFIIANLSYLFSKRYFKFKTFDKRIWQFCLFIVLILISLFVFIDNFEFIIRFGIKVIILVGTLLLLSKIKLLNIKNIKEILQIS